MRFQCKYSDFRWHPPRSSEINRIPLGILTVPSAPEWIKILRMSGNSQNRTLGIINIPRGIAMSLEVWAPGSSFPMRTCGNCGNPPHSSGTINIPRRIRMVLRAPGSGSAMRNAKKEGNRTLRIIDIPRGKLTVGEDTGSARRVFTTFCGKWWQLDPHNHRFSPRNMDRSRGVGSGIRFSVGACATGPQPLKMMREC